MQPGSIDTVAAVSGAVSGTAEALSPRERQLAGLRPWKKGQSGNPAGKVKSLEEARLAIRALAQSKSEHAMKKLFQLLESRDERIVLMAAKEVLAHAVRTPGKQEGNDAGAKGQLTINILRFTDAGEQVGSQSGRQAESTRVVSVT